MVSLDLEKINNCSPYKVLSDTNGCVFVTDYGDRYGAYFDPDDMLKSSEVYQFSDGRQDMRSRLFAHWFYSFADEKQYIYRHIEVEDEGVINYITMILRKDNPDAALILEEWDANIFAINGKPE